MKNLILILTFFVLTNSVKSQLCIKHYCNDTLIQPRDSMALVAYPNQAVKARVWTQTSGPAAARFMFTASLDSVIAYGLIPGRYIFTYTATTISETKAVRDTINVVAQPCPVCPVCPAQKPQRIAITVLFLSGGKVQVNYNDGTSTVL